MRESERKCVKERVCVCVRARVRAERGARMCERESVCVCMRERERECISERVCVCGVCARE